MKCPNCGIEPAAGAEDCAGCGIIFAKFKKKLESLPAPVPSKVNPWLGRSIAVTIVLIWMAVLILYYHRAVSGMPVRNPAGPARRR